MDPASTQDESTGEVRGIHVERVARFFCDNVPGGDVPLAFELLAGGRSNLTYRVRGGDRSWVLRRPPLGHVLPTAHDMAREYRVLHALADSDVPTPHVFALCEDDSVNDAPFYVMDYRPGVVLDAEIPAGFADSAADRQRIGLALVDTLVRLHAVDYEAAGLAGFGRPAGYLERQVRRWSQQWERSMTGELPAIEELIRRLRGALPSSPTPTIVHGDFRLGNLALAPDDPGRVIAVFDWEMATLGDPLADLGYTLMYWAEPGDAAGGSGPLTLPRVTGQPGFATRAELIDAYAQRSGRNVENVDFYQVLAHYKLAVIAEGIYARHLQGKTLGAGFEGMRRESVHVAERALELADGAADPRLRGA